MQHHAAVLGGDLRQHHLAQMMQCCGFSVSCFDVPKTENTHTGLRDVLKNAELLLLPVPALCSGDAIRSENGGIPADTVLEQLPQNAMIFGGGLGAIREKAEALGHRVFDYLEDKALTAANAVPTAEGAIRIAMQELPITLSGCEVLVIGFGRIGKALSDRLHGLHAAVTVSARRPEDLRAIENYGLHSDQTGVFLHGLRQYDCIFNTVPSPILTQPHLLALKEGCLIIDLASGSGCTDAKLPPTVRLLRAPGLPGKEAPKTAAALLRDCILNAIASQ